MSDLAYLIWILATAAMTVAVLTVGTLAAAGMLPISQRRARSGGGVLRRAGSDEDQAPPHRAA